MNTMNTAKSSCCCSESTHKTEFNPKEDRRTRRRLRWGIGRKSAAVTPGLYSIGSPDESSPVFVSANYTMSFNYLKSSLQGFDSWILVLDTKGINVWCAAGKGTFGTEELISRIGTVKLEESVSHKQLILPQLGAPGIQAHEVTRQTGFKIIWGPVRAQDIPEFLENGRKSSEQMRTVTFSFRERAVLTPLELVQSWKLLAGVIPYAVLFHLLWNRGVTPMLGYETALYLGSILVGGVGTPLLLPWIPGRSLALKGWFLGIVYTLAAGFLYFKEPLVLITYLLLLPPISSFLSLNFTGATTYTSLSGVKKEMKYALPLVIISAAAGTALSIVQIFL